ncbi:prepilin-type N-terminal cleavage/methylation domain-containing protein [Bdellovibrio sp. HCB185ZH]|uniref:prepilin-type N-terminal cleavage/methylation domain-containing protein n=1 Tax=Bdellovibrio sp. HCB185ZH TaxID=3394235 RepID=UPI0039A51E14
MGQQGFSLVELLLSVVLGSVLMYGVGALISMATNQNEAITNRIQSESELNEISFYLKHFASQGINVEDGSGKNLNGWSPSGTSQNTGFVRADYLASTGFNAATATASVDTIGFFLRDTLISTYTSVPSVGDRFLPTGIYFQKPTAKTYGILYIDLGRSQAAGTVTISPTRDDLWFGSIVDFQATEKEVERFDMNSPDQDPNVSQRFRLSSVTFKVTVREYLPQTNSKRDFTWCPPAAMTQAACMTTSPYKDVERVIRVVFRDNVLGFSSAQMSVTAETPNTLRAQRRPLYRRPYDLIYFLKPSYPSGQLKRN